MAKKVNIKVQKEDEVSESNARVFTYIGGGEDSPRVIEFMGRQKFVRGKATEVSDPIVLAKIANNPTFIEGEVDEESIHEIDEEARDKAEAQRKIDMKVNKAFQKKHNKE